MNKWMITFASLLIAVPAVAMELVVITEKEHKDFLSRLSQEVEFSNKVFEDGKIGDKNLVRIALNTLSTEFSTHNNNLRKILKLNPKTQKISYDIMLDINKKSFIENLSNKIQNNSENIELAQSYKIRARQILADAIFRGKYNKTHSTQRINGIDLDGENCIEPLLKNKHPQFICMINNIDNDDKIDYLVKNNNEIDVIEIDLTTAQGKNNIQVYMGLLVYQMLLAYID